MSGSQLITQPTTSSQGDTLDSICHRHYGNTDLLEVLAELNPHTLQTPLLSDGMIIALPLVSKPQMPTPNTIHLWGKRDA